MNTMIRQDSSMLGVTRCRASQAFGHRRRKPGPLNRSSGAINQTSRTAPICSIATRAIAC